MDPPLWDRQRAWTLPVDCGESVADIHIIEPLDSGNIGSAHIEPGSPATIHVGIRCDPGPSRCRSWYVRMLGGRVAGPPSWSVGRVAQHTHFSHGVLCFCLSKFHRFYFILRLVLSRGPDGKLCRDAPEYLPVKLHISGLGSQGPLYRSGLKPAIAQIDIHKPGPVTWKALAGPVKYTPRAKSARSASASVTTPDGDSDREEGGGPAAWDVDDYGVIIAPTPPSIEFGLRLPVQDRCVACAFCFPWAFSDMAALTGAIARRLATYATVYSHYELLTLSARGRPVHMLTFTNGRYDPAGEREPAVPLCSPPLQDEAPSLRANVPAEWPAWAKMLLDSPLTWPAWEALPEDAWTLPMPSPDRPLDSGKPAIVVTARVHPGETPASFILSGMLHILTDPDNELGHALRDRFVWHIVPCICPDGVAEGCYRTDVCGINLNRVYDSENLTPFPTISAVKNLAVSLAERGRLAAYLDLHAHANKKGAFFYGNRCARLSHAAIAQALPAAIARHTPHMDPNRCVFSASAMSTRSASDAPGQSKAGCSRVAVAAATGAALCMTYESHYAVSTAVGGSGPKLGPDAWEQMGYGLLAGLADLFGCEWSGGTPSHGPADIAQAARRLSGDAAYKRAFSSLRAKVSRGAGPTDTQLLGRELMRASRVPGFVVASPAP